MPHWWGYFSVFRERPPTPPSRAAELQISAKEEESYLTSIKNLMKNKGYLLLLITYGMNVGVFYVISTLLNTTVVKHFHYQVESFLCSYAVNCTSPRV